MIEVPDIVLVDLRHNMFEYIRDAKENGKFEGRTNTRISNLSKHIIGTVNKRYRLNSKGNTTTALFHIGSFRMQKMLDQESYNKFDELRGCIDDNALFIPEMVGTAKHLEYHKMKTTLSQASQLWRDTKNTIFQIEDNENDVFMNYYNDERFGHLFDIFTESFGYTKREIADLVIIYAVYDCDIYTNTPQQRVFGNKLLKAVECNTNYMNTCIKEFNKMGYSLLDF